MTFAAHLWQSTLFAALAALLAWGLRRSSARTRHAIWLVASAKFLMPLSLFVAAGRVIGGWMSSIATLPASGALDWLDRSMAFWRFDVVAAPAATSDGATGAIVALIATWLVGIFVLAARRVVEWRRLSAMLRQSSALATGREADALGRAIARHSPGANVALLQHESRIEPGVLGLVHSRLVWPASLTDRLSEAELDAIMAHEICHVGRRDNLAALLHVIVETVFWFHPMVWWIGARLVDERERACDEEVLEMGTDNRSYAEGIVKVCGFCLRAPAAFVAGVGGAGLSDRVEGILTWRASSTRAWSYLVPVALVLLTAGVPVAAGAVAHGRGPQQKEQVEKPGDGVTVPRIVREVKPQYTIEAKKAKIQGSVWLQAVVLKDGTVGDVTVTKSLDSVYGLDDEAVKALKQWLFAPGTKDQQPVAVQVEVEMTFTLK